VRAPEKLFIRVLDYTSVLAERTLLKAFETGRFYLLARLQAIVEFEELVSACISGQKKEEYRKLGQGEREPTDLGIQEATEFRLGEWKLASRLVHANESRIVRTKLRFRVTRHTFCTEQMRVRALYHLILHA